MEASVARPLSHRVDPLPLATFQHLSDPDFDIIRSRYGPPSFYLQKGIKCATFWEPAVAAPHTDDLQHLAQQKVWLKLQLLSPILVRSGRHRERELPL